MRRHRTQEDISANYWAQKPDGSFMPVSISEDKLPAGRYLIERDYNDNLIYKPVKDEFESIIYNPTSQAKEILDEVDLFWERGDWFAAHNITQRMGLLLFGVQGCGKSVILKHIEKKTIRDGGIVFQATPYEGTYYAFIEALRTLRKIEPKRPLVCVYEEIDKIVAKSGDSELLGILDGESSINHVINVATTNHPEELDPTIVNRPRRFDRMIEVGFPDEETRRTFFSSRHLAGEELELWISKTADLSFAAMTELFILVKGFNRDFDKSLKRMHKMMVESPKLDKFKKQIGFGSK
jgi:hypothetical protein